MDASLYQQMRELEDRHWWFRGRRAIVVSQLQTSHLPKQAKILDLGCGTGGNLAMLSQFGDVIGAELDEQAAIMARERGVAPVVRGKLPDALPLSASSFDCVTLLDVLEHIVDDRSTLMAVNKLLVPDGRVLITVPAFPFLWGPHDEAHHHQRRYRAKPLAALLRDTGFEVIKLSYCNTWLFPPAAAVRLVRKVFPKGNAGTELALPPAPLNAMLAMLFASERHLLRHMTLPFGISLLAVAKKLPE
ncbi:MAG: class I SAM-dependent methyltransferase [Ectothiorhodospiraceae bacterium]|nr:class I SAM-dependent methyltransferase [Ectothiorhodospiraceae bacterium]